jgi:hypothetical protein
MKKYAIISLLLLSACADNYQPKVAHMDSQEKYRADVEECRKYAVDSTISGAAAMSIAGPVGGVIYSTCTGNWEEFKTKGTRIDNCMTKKGYVIQTEAQDASQ